MPDDLRDPQSPKKIRCDGLPGDVFHPRRIGAATATPSRGRSWCA